MNNLGLGRVKCLNQPNKPGPLDTACPKALSSGASLKVYQNATNSSITFIPLLVSDNKVLIVIGGDSNYRNEDEKARSVISRWAKRKVASQFDEEYLDGRKSFIFSWDEKHRPIHEQAMRHFLDPSKRGFTFEYTPPTPLPKPIAPVVPQPSRKSEAPKVLARPAIPYSRLEVGL